MPAIPGPVCLPYLALYPCHTWLCMAAIPGYVVNPYLARSPSSVCSSILSSSLLWISLVMELRTSATSWKASGGLGLGGLQEENPIVDFVSLLHTTTITPPYFCNYHAKGRVKTETEESVTTFHLGPPPLCPIGVPTTDIRKSRRCVD